MQSSCRKSTVRPVGVDGAGAVVTGAGAVVGGTVPRGVVAVGGGAVPGGVVTTVGTAVGAEVGGTDSGAPEQHVQLLTDNCIHRTSPQQ